MQHAYNEIVPATKPPTTRDLQRQQTQARILASARRLFADSGYDRTTIRAVATHASVNPGLVVHYFGSKENLFRQAASLSPDTTDSPTPTPEQLTEHLLGSLSVKLEDLSAASVAALRSMLTHPEAAQDVHEVINRQIQQIGAAIPTEDAALRATLIASTILGVVIGRHLLGLDALRDATPAQVADLLRPCFHALADDAVHDS
jgi:AcrR family transcriptional regulator